MLLSVVLFACVLSPVFSLDELRELFAEQPNSSRMS